MIASFLYKVLGVQHAKPNNWRYRIWAATYLYMPSISLRQQWYLACFSQGVRPHTAISWWHGKDGLAECSRWIKILAILTMRFG